jgi:hypothetical protein
MNSNEKSHKRICLNFQQKHEGFVNVCMPDPDNPEHLALANYNLPAPLESYKAPPRKAVQVPGSKSRSKSNEFVCSQCPAKLASSYGLKTHEVIFHSFHYDCTFCPTSYSLQDEEKFKKHLFRHEHRKHECIHCGYSTSLFNPLATHLKHEGPYHGNKCTQCDERFKSHQDFKVTKKVVQGESSISVHGRHLD